MKAVKNTIAELKSGDTIGVVIVSGGKRSVQKGKVTNVSLTGVTVVNVGEHVYRFNLNGQERGTASSVPRWLETLE